MSDVEFLKKILLVLEATTQLISDLKLRLHDKIKTGVDAAKATGGDTSKIEESINAGVDAINDASVRGTD